jgi:aminoglycoside 6-adenylyltransferase
MTVPSDAAGVAAGFAEIEQRAQTWAAGQTDVLAAVVIGSRARSDHPADEWADLDIIVVAHGTDRFFADRTWLRSVGEPWFAFAEVTVDGSARELRVMFAGGFDVDFAFMTTEVVDRLLAEDPVSVAAALERGHRVLDDKGGIAARMTSVMAGTDDTLLPSVPDADAFDEVCADFWYHSVWTAKHLRRGELWWAKGCCDGRLKDLLRRMLEWEAAAEGRDAWFRGRFFEEWADPDTVAGLRTAFADYVEAHVWQALGRTMGLFAGAAARTAASLDLTYAATMEAEARSLVDRLRPDP